MSEPTGPIATSGIEVFTLGTPNGYKVSVLLEELRQAYPSLPAVTYQTVNIMKNTQKEPWYTKICPNGRIPAIVDHERAGFPVFEGLAILNYLAKHYDPDHKLSFPYESDEYEVAQQWMAWQHGGLGPMSVFSSPFITPPPHPTHPHNSSNNKQTNNRQGQANHFLRFAKEKIPYGIQRYIGESERLYGILDARLSNGREYVAGDGKGKYSVADISLLGWANIAELSGIDLSGQFPNVAAWLDRCLAREGTKKGFAVPQESSFSNAAIRKKIAEDPEAKKQAEDAKKLIEDAKAQYGYKYASP